MERKWVHHLVTLLFAIAVLLAMAVELRLDFAALAGTPAASVQLGSLLKIAGATSSVSGAFHRVRLDGMQNVVERLGVNAGRQ